MAGPTDAEKVSVTFSPALMRLILTPLASL